MIEIRKVVFTFIKKKSKQEKEEIKVVSFIPVNYSKSINVQ